MIFCATCGSRINQDAVGLTKKLINRGMTTYYCIPCLAKRFKVTEESLEQMIVTFRLNGCTLFS